MQGMSAALLVLACLMPAGCASRSTGLFSNARDNSAYVLCATAGQPVPGEEGSGLKENDPAITQPCNPGI